MMLAGVCTGLGEYLSIDPAIPRVVFVVMAVLGGSGVVLYALLWLIIPEEPKGQRPARSILQDIMEHSMEHPKKAEDIVENTEQMAQQFGESVKEEAAKVKKAWKSGHSESEGHGSFTAGLILLTLGALFLMQNYMEIDFGKLWPVILVVMGLGILLKSVGRRS